MKIFKLCIFFVVFALSTTAFADNYTKNPIDWKLFEAIEWGYDIEQLLKQGADPDAVALANVNSVREGETPWIYALYRAKPEIIELLYKYRKTNSKIPVSFQVKIFSNIIGATQVGNPNYAIDRLKLILKYGLDINSINLSNPNKEPYYGFDDKSPLMSASEIGDVRILGFLIENGAQVNLQNKYGKTALSYAANGETAKLLLKYGANINLIADHGRTILEQAVNNKHSDVVYTILNSGNKISKEALNRALYLACNNANDKNENSKVTKIIEILIQAGADVNYEMEEHKELNPLVLAIRYSNTPIVSLLIKYGANPKQNLNQDGRSLMSIALQQEDPEIVKILWPFYQPVSEELRKEWVVSAGNYGKPESVKMLTSLGFNLTSENKEAAEAFYNAVEREEFEIVKLLLSQGADPNIEIYNQNILSVAIHNGNFEIISLLINNGAKVIFKNEDYYKDIPIRAAVSEGNLKVFDLLVQNGAILTSDKTENSLLHAFPIYLYDRDEDQKIKNAIEILVKLIKAGNDINAEDYQGQNLLSKMAAQDIDEFVIKAIELGADVNFIPKKCNTLPAINKAIESISHTLPNSSDILINVKALKRAPNTEDAMDDTCMAPIHNAIYSNRIKNIKTLIEAKANVNLASKYNGTTPLMAAAINGNPEIIKLLLDNGANPKLKNNAGQTAAEIAKLRENTRAESIISGYLTTN